MATLDSRLAKLEALHTGPAVIHVCIVDNGRYYPASEDLDGPGMSEDEYRAVYPVGPDDRVIHVGYTEGERNQHGNT